MIIRSKYTLKQFEQVFRAIAHKAAIEAVTKLEPSMKITTDYWKGVLTEVSTKHYYFKFDSQGLPWRNIPRTGHGEKRNQLDTNTPCSNDDSNDLWRC